MKHKFRSFLCMLLCVMLMLADVAMISPASAFYSKVSMLKIINHIEKYVDMGEYAPVQGACVDGKYAYFAVVQGGVCHVAKFNTDTWKYVDSKSIINMGHSNDMAYNPDKDYLVVANNEPYYDVVTLIDPDTLVPIKDVKIKQKIYSIAYNAKRKNYVVGLSGSYDFALLDSNFKLVKKFKGKNTGYTRQGGDCDDDYIYFVQSGGNNILVVYDYSGNLVGEIPMTDSNEVENIFHIGNSFYTTLYYHGNYLHRIGFSDKTIISYKVNYDPNGGEGEMAASTVTYGKNTPLSTCTFTKDDYLFAGWRIQRSVDDKVIGYRNGSSEFEWLDEDDVFNYHLYKDRQEIATTVKFGSVKAYAEWVSKEYGISFNSGDGEGDSLDVTVKRNAEYQIPDAGYYKEGYIFDGYTATRDADGRVYGYRKGKKKPEWLNKGDVEYLYRFHTGDSVKNLTPEGAVSMTAQYQYAYTFSDDGTMLTGYVGVDSKVHIPDNDGALTTLAQGAFKDNDILEELYIPDGVTTMQAQSVSGCPNLRKVFFLGAIPDDMDGDCIVSRDPTILYQVHDGHAYWIGFYSGPVSKMMIRCQGENITRCLKEWELTHRESLK